MTTEQGWLWCSPLKAAQELLFRASLVSATSKTQPLSSYLDFVNLTYLFSAKENRTKEPEPEHVLNIKKSYESLWVKDHLDHHTIGCRPENRNKVFKGI